ncbi:MAG TPA: winged helix-turn-helix transcriptional regulator, partial [Archaeoglobaceae archaeon]|nr:winged helix-turn-helix transcriptional regulator [Archaeoglobaceae archaeon]
MVGIFDLDGKDKAILEILAKNPEVSQNEIAKEVGLSQPSVGA